ncbi:MAG: hypothetical protein ACQER9_01045 [Nanobdellota archaeon]
MAEINYICKDCNYRFKRSISSKAKLCPYCGSNKIEEYKPVTADDILKSVNTEE